MAFIEHTTHSQTADSASWGEQQGVDGHSRHGLSEHAGHSTQGGQAGGLIQQATWLPYGLEMHLGLVQSWPSPKHSKGQALALFH
jgi:hypothetical protein